MTSLKAVWAGHALVPRVHEGGMRHQPKERRGRRLVFPLLPPVTLRTLTSSTETSSGADKRGVPPFSRLILKFLLRGHCHSIFYTFNWRPVCPLGSVNIPRQQLVQVKIHLPSLL